MKQRWNLRAVRGVVIRVMARLLRSLALLFCTAVTASACVRPVVTHTAPPVVVLPTQTPVLNVTAELPDPQPAQPAPPTGNYWVRRLTRGIHVTSGVGQEREYSGEVECVPATIDRQVADKFTFTLGPFSFVLAEWGDHWTLWSPTLTPASPAFSIRGDTYQEIDRLDESSDAVVLTTVGALFREREACAAHSTRFTLRCVEDACEEIAPTERPFLLPACEQEMAEAERMRARVIDVPDAALARTLTRADALIAHGGTMWEYVTDEAQCRTLTAKPRKQGGVKLSQHYTTRDGRRVARDTEFELLRPSTRQAIPFADSSSVTFPDGSQSGSASGMTIPSPILPLYVGDQFMLVDKRELYLAAASCRARQAQGSAPALPAPFTRDAQ